MFSDPSKVTVKGQRADAEQRRILGRALELAHRYNAPYKAKVALVEALIVESTARNLRGGDRDSVGVLQARQQFFNNPRDLRDPAFQIGIFLGRGRGTKKFPKGFTGGGNAISLAKTGMKSGDIAQTIEGSAFPHRYQEVQKEAMKIVRLYNGGGTPSQGPVSATGPTTVTLNGVDTQQFDEEAYRKAKGQAVLGAFLKKRNPNNPLLKLGVVNAQDPNPANFQKTVKGKDTKVTIPGNRPAKFDWVIGDSIAVGASSVLKGAKSNAKGGIGTPAGVDRLKESNPSGVVLVSLGSNDDPRYPENFRKQIRRALKVAPNATLVWATTAVKGKEKFNRILRQEAARSDGRLLVADWGGAASTSDGVHPRDYAAYVRRVKRALGSVATSAQEEQPSPRGGRTWRAQGLSPIKELFYDPQGGWKNGQSIGAIGDHVDHVHVAAGPKTIVRLGKRAQQMGLHVGENPHFGGVAPVHVANSNHYRDEAIDVGGTAKKMAAFARYIRRLYELS